MITSGAGQAGNADSPRKLISWKQIANHFGCDERTAKRWERERGLPVHRAPGNKRSGVFAYKSELDSWERSGGRQQIQHSGVVVDWSEGMLDDKVSAAVGGSPAIGDAFRTETMQEAIWQRHHRLAIWASVSLSTFLVAVAALVVVKEHRATTLRFTRSKTALNVGQHVPAPGAEELYLRGRYFWSLRTVESLAKATDFYTRAVIRDPFYAEAYAGLAETYDLMPQFGQADFAESLSLAEAAADRAIALNSNLADAHAAKAFALFFMDWDISGSDAEFRRAIALDPNSALTHQWYASTLACRDDGAATLREIGAALHLNPASTAITAEAALFQADFGDFEAGEKTLREIEQMQPRMASPPYFLRELDFETGNFPAYLEDARRYASITHSQTDMALANAVARGYAEGGKKGLLEARARVLKAAFDSGAESGFKLGETLLLQKHLQRALQYFQASVHSHDVRLLTMPDCPWAKSLSNDPGYAALFAEIRRQLHGSLPAHRSVVRASIRLPG